MNEEQLEIVNEQDEVVGLESRMKIHAEGLLHREIHVWFYTPRGEIILQHRAKDKDTYPDLLDATVGGHVEPGMSYEDTAVKEMKEETGIDAKKSALVFLTKLCGSSTDVLTGKINNAFKMEFAYEFNGDIQDLKVEEGKAIGFETCSIEAILDISGDDKKRFIPKFLDVEYQDLFRQIRALLRG